MSDDLAIVVCLKLRIRPYELCGLERCVPLGPADPNDPLTEIAPPVTMRVPEAAYAASLPQSYQNISSFAPVAVVF